MLYSEANENQNNDFLSEENSYSVKNDKEDVKRGIKFGFASQIFFILSTIHIKITCGTITPSNSLLFSIFRQIGTGLFAYLYFSFSYFNKEKITRLSIIQNIVLLFKPHMRSILIWMILRSTLLFFGFIFAIYGIINLKQITFSLIIDLNPILSHLFAPFLTGQKFKFSFFFTTLIAFVGVGLMIVGSQMKNPNENDGDVHGHHQQRNEVLGLISVIIPTFSILFTNFSLITLSTAYDSYNLLYISSVFSLIIGFIFNLIISSFLFSISFSLLHASNGFVNGILMFFAFNLLFHSFQCADISKVVYISYIQIPTLAIFGFFYADETLSFLEIIGGAILFSTILYNYKYLS